MAKYFQPEIETAPLETIREIQNERLINTVNRVYNNVELYRERMNAAGVKPEDIRSIDDLHKLPFTYKQDLRDTYPYGMMAVPMSEVVELHASSGTTGKQIVVGYTENDLKSWADICARQLYAVGADENDYVHVAYGYGLFTGGFGLHIGAKRIGATTIPVSSGNTPRQITILKDFGSTVLCCTPSYALYIGETLEQMGLTPDDISLKAGIFGAEPWTEGMRKDIEKKLGLKAYDIYGLTEVMGPGVAFECEEQSGMHVNEDHFIVEIIDPDTGEVLPVGEEGEIVFTCITKEAFPILRYRTRDIGVQNEQTARTHGRYAHYSRCQRVPVADRNGADPTGLFRQLSADRRSRQQHRHTGRARRNECRRVLGYGAQHLEKRVRTQRSAQEPARLVCESHACGAAIHRTFHRQSGTRDRQT